MELCKTQTILYIWLALKVSKLLVGALQLQFSKQIVSLIIQSVQVLQTTIVFRATNSWLNINFAEMITFEMFREYLVDELQDYISRCKVNKGIQACK